MLCFAIRSYGISPNCSWWFLTCSTILRIFFSFLYSALGWLDVNIMFFCVSFKLNYAERAQRRANICWVKTHNILCSYATEWENRTAVYTIITLGMSECTSAPSPRRLWWSKCETDKVHRCNFSLAQLFNSSWMAKHRPRTSSASHELGVVLYKTSTANKCFIALFTQWNLFIISTKRQIVPAK